MKSQAVIFTAPYKVELGEVELLEMTPTSILIRTLYSGLSVGTERWWLIGKRPEGFFPSVPGYQGVGTVIEVGNQVKRFKVGDTVFFRRSRLPEPYGRSWMGSHLAFAVCDESDHVFKIPKGCDLREAAVSALPAVSFMGIGMAKPKRGEFVVVIGQGMIGQCSAQLCRRLGCFVVTADKLPLRVRLSAEYSSDRAVNVDEENLVDVVRQLKPDGADLVIETSGVAELADLCIELIRVRGRVCFQGWYPGFIPIHFHRAHAKWLTAYFPCSHTLEDQVRSLRLCRRGELKLLPLITHCLPATDAPKAYEMILNHPEKFVGIILDWSAVS
ncbi:MAG: hypothetical protein GDYSWBUE_000482 [Candidatus Fervidibacterota bacterium]